MRGPSRPSVFLAPSCSASGYAEFGNSNGEGVEGLPALQDYPAGVRLFTQGGASADAFFIAEGLVKLQRVQDRGQEVIVGLRGTGWFLAASAIVLERAHVVTAVTVTECTLSRIPAPQFRGLVRESRAFSWRILRMNSEEIHDQLVEAADRSSLPARERLERFLTRLVPRDAVAGPNGQWRVPIPLRQWEIADLIGVTPQYVCQLFHELEREKLAAWDGNDVILAPRLAGMFDSKRGPGRRDRSVPARAPA